MKRGSKPKSNVVKFTTGNPGKRPLNDSEPKPDGDVVKPSSVKGRATKIWKRYAPALVESGLLTSWDAHSFAAWCCLTAEFEKSPELFTSAKLGQMRHFAEMFGLAGQSSRARLKSNEKETADPAEKYFN